MHQELKDTIVRVQEVAKYNDKKTGIYAVSGEQARAYADEGFDMVRSVDIYSSLCLSIAPDLRHSRYGRFTNGHDLGTFIG